MTTVPSISLGRDVAIPQLGFGVAQMSDEEVVGLVGEALAAGYRGIDTAAAYGNERGVGRAIAGSSIPRSEIFVTSKLANDRHGFDEARRAFDETIERLGVDVLDLYLIHWPMPMIDKYVETWKALDALRAEGRVRAIGVSNFQASHLTRLMNETGVVPAVNQIELHPTFQQRDLVAFHRDHGIATEAWSPLAKGALGEPAIIAIALKHKRSPAQVTLRWHQQYGNITIPKSATPARIKENIAIFDFALDEDDMEVFAKLDRGNRLGAHPDFR